MGHGNSDRLYVTHDEMSGVYGNHTASGGQRVRASDVGFQRLPFDCCALSLQPWTIPVCSISDGTLFELTNIIPFLKKHGVNPATGSSLQGKDLLRVNFFKNANGKYHDPVSFKEFNEHSHIIAIKTSGNVFLFDTIQQLNIKVKHLHDLIDDTSFTKKDIITLQDPHNVELKNVNKLHHLQNGLKWVKDETAVEEINADATGSAGKLLKQMKEAKEKNGKDEARDEAKKDGMMEQISSSSTLAKEKIPYNATNASTGMMAASFTSSGLNVQTKSERLLINEEEYMFEKVAAGEGISKGKNKGKTKAYVRMETNFGPLNLELHVDKAPKTCYNFLELAKAGKYTDTMFHRNIKGFMIQGGDPTGTGRGGESIWGTPFRDEIDVQGAFRHSQRGTLSMANKGPGTNGSQFFFSYREKLPHLDSKHTVFGRAIEGEKGRIEALDKMEEVPSETGTDRPMRSIRILQVYILENPFDEWKNHLEKRLARENVSEADQRERLEKKRRREEDRTTWLGTNLGAKGEKMVEKDDFNQLARGKNGTTVGRYLQNEGSKPSLINVQSNGTNKKQRSSNDTQFGDFSSW